MSQEVEFKPFCLNSQTLKSNKALSIKIIESYRHSMFLLVNALR